MVLCRGFGWFVCFGFWVEFSEKAFKGSYSHSSLSRLAPEVPALFTGNPLTGQIIGGRQEVGYDSLDPAPTSFSC